MYKVYAIYNSTADKLYIGQTNNLDARLDKHNNSVYDDNAYAHKFPGEWKLIYQESVATRQEALLRERQLKSHRGREFIKSYIPG